MVTTSYKKNSRFLNQTFDSHQSLEKIDRLERIKPNYFSCNLKNGPQLPHEGKETKNTDKGLPAQA